MGIPYEISFIGYPPGAEVSGAVLPAGFPRLPPRIPHRGDTPFPHLAGCPRLAHNPADNPRWPAPGRISRLAHRPQTRSPAGTSGSAARRKSEFRVQEPVQPSGWVLCSRSRARPILWLRAAGCQGAGGPTRGSWYRSREATDLDRFPSRKIAPLCVREYF